MTKNRLKNDKKKEKPPLNFWSFAWKIENRPAYKDFEKKNNLDPQLHQIFKPIGSRVREAGRHQPRPQRRLPTPLWHRAKRG